MAYVWIEEKKEEIWFNSMTKAPTPTEKFKNNMKTHQRHQKRRLQNDFGLT